MEDPIKEQVNASIGVEVLYLIGIESEGHERNQDYVFARMLASFYGEPPGTLAGCRYAAGIQFEHPDGTIDDRCCRAFF
jgi:hypothetical protein